MGIESMYNLFNLSSGFNYTYSPMAFMYSNPIANFWNYPFSNSDNFFAPVPTSMPSNPWLSMPGMFDMSSIFTQSATPNFSMPDFNMLNFFQTPQFQFPYWFSTQNNSLDLNRKYPANSVGRPDPNYAPRARRNNSNAELIAQLQPGMQERVKMLVEYTEKNLGKKLVITDGYRSRTQQADLYRRKPNLAAPPGRSLHEHGLAVDLNIIGGSDTDLKKLGAYAKTIGLRWGGDFKSKHEPWHFDSGHSL